jgi:DNA-binding XRE family transcriptional regulator/desulfoferrodoxin (superoxide reductase-like protein)
MDLGKNGELLRFLRKEKRLTQSHLASKLGVVAKTVSKWETGRGFPDVSLLPRLAEVLGVSERTLLSGEIYKNKVDNGNVKKTKFYVCPTCGSTLNGLGDSAVFCCGKELLPLTANSPDDAHSPTLTDVENDLYVEFNHPMDKNHYILFVTFIGIDRTLTVRLYPEGPHSVRIPKAYTGKLVYYCTMHGLYELSLKRK